MTNLQDLVGEAVAGNNLDEDGFEYRSEWPILQVDGKTVRLHMDGEMGLTLWKQEVYLGGISVGHLKRYYDTTWIDYAVEQGGFDRSIFEKYFSAIKEAGDSWGVVQMQFLPGNAELRNGFNPQRKLLKKMTEVASVVGEELRFFLPAHLNYWAMPNIQFIMDDAGDGTWRPPNDNALKMNYDVCAKRNHYDNREGSLLLWKSD
jgi:hypothetical protein